MAGEDKAYRDWLHGQACIACVQGGRLQDYRTSVHHRTGAGLALRAHDHEGIPLCGDGVRGCHGSAHSLMFGPFKGWTKARLREWQEDRIKELRNEYLATQMGSAEVGAEEVF